MSVYTPVAAEEMSAWLARYNVGALIQLSPIASGIENSNFFVDTTKGQYVLSLYERLPADELPFYLNLMAHLAREGIPCPAPVPDRSGGLFSMLNGRPASLVNRLEGVAIEVPDTAHCAAAGGALGRLHLASSTFRTRQPNARGPAWWRQAERAVRPHLDTDQKELLAGELKAVGEFELGTLPRGAIHGDLFCDNVLFTGTRVTGIVDFGFAATDYLAYDLAIAVNDWCSIKSGEHEGTLVPELVAAMVDGYVSVRPLTADERRQWSTLLRAAALRFWLSRLYDQHLPRHGEITHAHDPARFERILRDRARSLPTFPDTVGAMTQETH